MEETEISFQMMCSGKPDEIRLLPGVVGQNGLVVVLQDSLHLAHDVELPVVQDLSQVGHAAHVHPLSWVTNSVCTLLH